MLPGHASDGIRVMLVGWMVDSRWLMLVGKNGFQGRALKLEW